ncbi:MAG: hypothetical protein ACNI25_14575 [Halarcobacter sp.]
MLKKYEEHLEIINSVVLQIAKNILSSNKIILEALKECDVSMLSNAEEKLNNISQKVVVMDNVVIKTLALFTPEATDLRHVVSFFKVSNELQRAAANTRSYIKTFEVYCNCISKDDLEKYAMPLHKSTIECLEGVIAMIECEEDEVKTNFDKVIEAEKRTDEQYNIFQSHIFSLDKKIEDFGKFTKILNVLRKNEKIADRSVDMAYLILFARIGGTLGEI